MASPKRPGRRPAPRQSSPHPKRALAPGARLAIGAVSRACGVPVATLRTWEQRYAFPEPERTPSGHRLYSPHVVPRLKRIAEALARGHRASQVVPASDRDLSALLDASPGRASATGTGPSTSGRDADDPGELAPLLQAVAAYDADELTRLLLADWAALGPTACLECRVAPLVQAVGERWANGSLEIRHEHFASEKLSDLLRLWRGPLDARAAGPVVVLTTLPGEAHGLGLQMAAVVMALAGLRVVQAGCQMPIEQVAGLAADVGAHAVGVSVSSASRGRASRRMLARLRRLLPTHVRLVVGGTGAPKVVEGGEVLDSLHATRDWADALPSS